MTDEFKRAYCQLVFDQVCNSGANAIKYWWVGRSKTRAFTGYNKVKSNRIIIVPPPRCGKTLAMAAFKQFCEYYYRDSLLKTEEAAIRLKSEE